MNLCSEKIEFIVFWYIEKVCCRETWLAQGEYFTTMGCGPSVLAKPYAEIWENWLIWHSRNGVIYQFFLQKF